VRTKLSIVALALGSVIVLAHPGVSAASSPRRRELHAAGPGASRTSPTTRISLTLTLRLPGSVPLKEYVAAQRVASSPIWLTASEIGRRYGIGDADLRALVSSLAAAHVHVTRIFPQRTALLAEGTARDVERLFHVRLHEFRRPDGVLVRTPSRSPTIPRALVGAVTSVRGLDTTPIYRPASPRPETSARSGGYLKPAQLRQVYEATDLVDGGSTGKGEVVAVASLATLHGDETKKWAKMFTTGPTPDKTVTVAPAPPGVHASDWDADGAGEVALDLEMVRAVAPDATIMNYQTRNDGAGLVRIVDQVVADHRASILSISWGSCEADSSVATDESAYESAEAAGVTVLVASGDQGPYDCLRPDSSNPDMRIAVDYPASSAHVIAVGGATLYLQDQKLFEEAWQDPQSTWGSGGGTSELVDRPSWQSSAVVHDTGAKRLVPDVAGPADNFLNLGVELWNSKTNKVFSGTAGGTSAAAPFWAGAIAITKQYVRARSGADADRNVAQLLYSIADDPTAYRAAFLDVTNGGSTLYPAGTGWDFVTGLGTPRITALATQWVARASGA
jgi:subtilase family serine protease